VLRPLPFQYADRLVAIWGVIPDRDTVKRGFSWPDTIDLAGAVRSLDGVAAMANAPAGMTLTGRGDAVVIPMRIVSGNFFEVLGVRAAVGRTLTPVEDVPRSARGVTISHALWQQLRIRSVDRRSAAYARRRCVHRHRRGAARVRLSA